MATKKIYRDYIENIGLPILGPKKGRHGGFINSQLVVQLSFPFFVAFLPPLNRSHIKNIFHRPTWKTRLPLLNLLHFDRVSLFIIFHNLLLELLLYFLDLDGI